MDSILIRGLRCQTHIGTTSEERDAPQPVEIDLELFLDLRPAGWSDRIEDTIDYLTLTRRVQELTVESRFHLLERLAEELATEILSNFPVHEVRLKLYKFPKAMMELTRSVAVEVRRQQASISESSDG